MDSAVRCRVVATVVRCRRERDRDDVKQDIVLIVRRPIAIDDLQRCLPFRSMALSNAIQRMPSGHRFRQRQSHNARHLHLMSIVLRWRDRLDKPRRWHFRTSAPEIARRPAVRKPDFEAPALGHGFMFDEADRVGHGAPRDNEELI